jgi:psiF repeat
VVSTPLRPAGCQAKADHDFRGEVLVVCELRIPIMLKRIALVSATLLPLTMGLGTAFAQAPTGQSSSVTKMSKADKEAISKACSEQANAQGLHGKARKKFRSKCKRTRDKAM